LRTEVTGPASGPPKEAWRNYSAEEIAEASFGGVYLKRAIPKFAARKCGGSLCCEILVLIEIGSQKIVPCESIEPVYPRISAESEIIDVTLPRLDERQRLSIHESLYICFPDNQELLPDGSDDKGNTAAEDNAYQIPLRRLVRPIEVVWRPAEMSAGCQHQSPPLDGPVDGAIRLVVIPFSGIGGNGVAEVVLQQRISYSEIGMCPPPSFPTKVVV
jgi:hypothetical protein